MPSGLLSNLNLAFGIGFPRAVRLRQYQSLHFVQALFFQKSTNGSVSGSTVEVMRDSSNRRAYGDLMVDMSVSSCGSVSGFVKAFGGFLGDRSHKICRKAKVGMGSGETGSHHCGQGGLVFNYELRYNYSRFRFSKGQGSGRDFSSYSYGTVPEVSIDGSLRAEQPSTLALSVKQRSVFKTPHLTPVARPAACASFTSSTDRQGEFHSDVEHEFQSDADDEVTETSANDPGSSCDLHIIMDILQTPGAQEKSRKLEQCGVNVTPGLVANVLSRTRNDWETAFTFFLWARKQPGYEHMLRDYHSMIAILGKFRKFDTAWSLIDEMRAASLVTPHTLLIMIRRYAAVHDVAKAINAFYGLRQFKFEIGIEEFQGLLSALCRYKNVKDAEHLLFCNRTVFPLNTKSFNIILNGWCNVIGDLREGKRIWREMEMRGIRHDVYSYASIMSCHSKVNNLNVVLRFYEKTKALGIRPDRKVYNAVIHALAKGRLVEEACSLMKTMEKEGCIPDTVTYNSLIMPLCKSRLSNEAKQVFDEMMERGLCPTIRTYHAFFRVLRTAEEVFELLHRMHTSGCHPNHDTYIMLIRKLCRWRQLENVYKLWAEMSKNGLNPDRTSYIVLIHGLFLNGRLEEAHKYYLEMKEKHFLPEPKIDAMLQEWLAAKSDADCYLIASKDNESTSRKLGEKERGKSKKNHRDSDFWRRPESRSFTRERGFSFLDH